MSEDNGFGWIRWIKGVFNPLLTAKLAAFAVHIALWVLLIVGCVIGFKSLKNWLFPQKAVSSPVTVTENSGSIETGADKRTKIGLINL